VGGIFTQGRLVMRLELHLRVICLVFVCLTLFAAPDTLELFWFSLAISRLFGLFVVIYGYGSMRWHKMW
jgi:hypothetical protein